MVIIILQIPRKGIFFLRKCSTTTSFAALIIIEVDGYSFALFLILIIGNIFLFTF